MQELCSVIFAFLQTLEKEKNALKLKVAGLQKDVLRKNEENTRLTEENTNLTQAVSGFEGNQNSCFIAQELI